MGVKPKYPLWATQYSSLLGRAEASPTVTQVMPIEIFRLYRSDRQLHKIRKNSMGYSRD